MIIFSICIGICDFLQEKASKNSFFDPIFRR